MKHTLSLLSALALLIALTACGNSATTDHDDAHDHAHGDTDDMQTGPRGGRLLEDGDFAIELKLDESAAPARYRAWASQNGQALAPASVNLVVTLTRLDGETQSLGFEPRGDALLGDGEITEPHSFDVAVVAEYGGQTHRWSYEQHEGRVTITAASAEAAGIVMASAGPRLIRDVLPLYGRVVADPESVREVGARFSGVVKSVTRSVGDTVKVGEVLARVESNDSLQVYPVTAPITGTVTARMTNPGEQAGTAALFVISDLSQVWAELSVFPRDLARIQLGQTVRLSEVEGPRKVEGRIARIAPSGSQSNQALQVWAHFDADEGGWIPGLHVNAEVHVGGAEVPLAVKQSGLQTFRDFTVVFTRVDDTFEVRMLQLGRRDGEYVEVLSGLKPGAPYVVENSYLIKADIEKSAASHDH